MTAENRLGQVMKVTLVQCTNAKRDEPSRAYDLYDESTYYRKQRDYAEATAEQWFIQSAEYGLLSPTQLVSPYDTRAGDLDAPEDWAAGIAAKLAKRYGGKATVEILGGKAYADPLVPELEAYGFEVHEPLRGKRIGERMAWLGDHA